MHKTNSNYCVLIVHKNNHAIAKSLASEIATWLLSKDYKAIVVSSASGHDYTNYTPNFIIVLGGDGSIIEVARQFVSQPVPIIGINFGKVGFLTSVNSIHWKECVQNHLDQKIQIHKQMALKWQIIHNNEVIHTGYAINDVVISRGTLSRVVTFNLHTDQHEICSLRADGLIISSPNGVTGYAVSAGGPLVYPSINALIITPICPFLCNFPPLILPYPMSIQASIISPKTETYITIDGQEALPLSASDFVKVEGVEAGVYFIKNPNSNYFSSLKSKGFIEERNSQTCSEAKK